jgi:hypothetical protein
MEKPVTDGDEPRSQDQEPVELSAVDMQRCMSFPNGPAWSEFQRSGQYLLRDESNVIKIGKIQNGQVDLISAYFGEFTEGFDDLGRVPHKPGAAEFIDAASLCSCPPCDVTVSASATQWKSS